MSSTAHPESLRRHLQRHILLLIAGALLLNAAVVSIVVVYESRDDLDEDLAMSAELLSLRTDIGFTGLPPLPIEISYQIWAGSDALREHSPDVTQAPIVPLRAGYQTYRQQGHLMRAYVTPTTQSGWIVVAAPFWHHLARRAGELAALMALPALLVFPLLAILIAVIVRRASITMRSTADQVAQRGRDNFEPVDASPLPSEVHPLVEAFNRLLERLAGSLDSERRFNDTAAHELRTPLAAIRLDAQLLQLRAEDPHLLEAIRRIEAASISGSQLLEELLTLARLPDRPQDAERAPMPLGRIVDIAIHDISAQLTRSGLRLTRDVEEQRIVPLSQLLHLVLRNLLDNAMRHATDLGELMIRARVVAGVLEVVVADDGPGIPAADRARIFERFVQLRGHGSGSGLGLYIVRRIAERFGGSVQVGEGLHGRGAGFTVLLPMPE